MQEHADVEHTLLESLSAIQFAERYYSFYEQCRDHSRMTGYTQDMLMQALTATGLDFAYQPREKLFVYREQHPRSIIGLNVAFPNSLIELVLVLQVDGQQLGGPFPRLARKVAQLRDPQFTYNPASPKLSFSNEQELQAGAKFGVALFHDVQQALRNTGLLEP